MALWTARRMPTRFLASTALALAVWAVVSAGWLDRTVVPQLDQALRDFYLSIAVDSRRDNAPGLLHLKFDNEALQSHGLPTRVPVEAIRAMLETVRHSREAVVVDVDLATRADTEAVAGLAKYLADWGQDAEAALLTLAYPLYEVPFTGMESFRLLDAVVEGSLNIRWGGVGTYADADGVVRNYEYWSCVDARPAPGVLPSVALYVWARHRSATPADAIASVDEAMNAAVDACIETGGSTTELTLFDRVLPRSGVIEYQTSVDALGAPSDRTGQFGPDGLPRLMTAGYCRIAPAACGLSGQATALRPIAERRIVLISAANEFSRDDHATPVGFLSGSVILGNAARALIVSGPPRPASRPLQMVLVLAAAIVIHAVWSFMDALRNRIHRARRGWLLTRKLLHGLLNPAVVQWVAFAAADVLILVYYFHAFPGSDWNGLVGASFGATTVAAIAAFNDWWSSPWEPQPEEKNGD